MRKVLVSLLILNLILLDFVTGFLIYKFIFEQSSNSATSEIGTFPKAESQFDGCDSDCQQEIFDRIESLEKPNEKVIVTPLPSVAVAQGTVVKQKTKSTAYVPIPGSGSILNTNWTEIPGSDFYLSKSDYVGLVGVYFEANFRLQNANGTANLRLYDKTHSIAPVGGEISTSSQLSTFATSGPVYLWEGNNNYVVQARSSTSDTTIFESGRLKIVTEN